MNRVCMDLTMVCATTGNLKKIKPLLYSIFFGTMLPKKVILVSSTIMDVEEINKIRNKCNNEVEIEIIITSRAGQVYQRNTGLRRVETDYIIQMDDDLLVAADAFRSLFEIISSSKKMIISPRVITAKGKSIFESGAIKYFLLKLHFFIFELKFPESKMQLMSSGKNFSSTIHEVTQKTIEGNEWLPSCLMYERSCLSDAITYEDAYGKGYYEDIIFTHSLFLKNYNLVINNEACFIHPRIDNVKVNDIVAVHSKHKYVVELFGKSKNKAKIDRFFSRIYYFIKNNS